MTNLPHRLRRDSGMALLSTIFLTLIVMGVTGPALLFALLESRASRESLENRQAFYLAEAGLEAAMWEISDNEDPDRDGVGNRTAVTPVGSYDVAVSYVGGGQYEVRSSGRTDNETVIVESLVERGTGTRFPYGAMTILGGFDKTSLHFKKHSGLLIDGGRSPAIRVSDADLHEQLVEAFEEAIEDGDMSRLALNGATAPGGEDDDDPSELPIQLDADDDGELDNVDGMFRELLTRSQSLRSRATTVSEPTGDDMSFGSEDNPALVHLPREFKLQHGETLSGHGTLIVSDRLKIQEGAALDWNGNVIVLSDGDKKAKLEVETAKVHVTGNVVVLGDSPGDSEKPSAELTIKNGARVAIDGSLMVASEHTNAPKSKVKIDVKEGGGLDVNGLLTMTGRAIEAKFKEKSDFNVNGMLQIAAPRDGDSDDSKLKLNFGGNTELRLDDNAIAGGIEALKRLEVTLDAPKMEVLFSTHVTRRTWRQSVGYSAVHGGLTGEKTTAPSCTNYQTGR